MTKKELSQLYYLNKEIEQQKRKLTELEAAAAKTSQCITGMPGAGNASDKVGTYAAEIADLKALIALNIQKCWYEKSRLERYIQGISDSLTRQIFSLRYINCLRWNQVADTVGGNNTENGVKQIHSRYLKTH